MKYLLMYNPVSGKRKFTGKVEYIQKYFADRKLNLDVYASTRQYDLMEKAEVFSEYYDVIIISGGDGSINEVINGIMKSDYRPRIGFLPSGTANDVATALGYKKVGGKRSIKHNLNIITNTTPVKMDVNSLNGRYFVYALAAGILTNVSYDAPRSKVKKYGYFAYVAEGAKDIFKDYNMEVTVKHDNGIVKGEFMLILGLSAKRVAGMFIRKFDNSKLDDGLMELRLVKARKHFKIPKLVSFFLSGGKKKNDDVHLQSSNFKITAKENVVWNTDGEKAGDGSIEIQVYKKELTVYVTEKAKKRLFSV